MRHSVDSIPRDRSMKDLVEEYGVLVRHLARLQQTVSTGLQQQQRTVQQLQAQALRLRGELLVARTQLCWAIGGAPCKERRESVLAPAATPPAGPRWAEAEAVLCRTACAGHAHPWRDEDGRCQRSGEDCASRRLATELPGSRCKPDVPQEDRQSNGPRGTANRFQAR